MLHLHALFVLALQETYNYRSYYLCPGSSGVQKNDRRVLAEVKPYRMIPPGDFSGLRKIKVRNTTISRKYCTVNEGRNPEPCLCVAFLYFCH